MNQGLNSPSLYKLLYFFCHDWCSLEKEVDLKKKKKSIAFELAVFLYEDAFQRKLLANIDQNIL